jgi:hypothetical protein
MNHQLFALNGGASGSRNPRKGLFRQARHLIAPRTEEMDVVAGAIGRRFISVPAKAPGSVHSLNSVKQARFLQGFKGSIDRYPVEGLRPFSSLEDILVR